MTYDIGPRSAAFRNVIKPIYRSIQLPLARVFDKLLGIRTTPATDSAPLERIPSRPLGWVHAIRLLRRYPLHTEDRKNQLLRPCARCRGSRRRQRWCGRRRRRARSPSRLLGISIREPGVLSLDDQAGGSGPAS
jgi:hypothetical protein